MSERSGGWARFFNEEHQLPYYFNADTGESLWEQPEGFEDGTADDAAAQSTPTDDPAASCGPPELTCLGDEDFYIFDDRLAFLDEMHRMGFMTAPPDEEVIFIFHGSMSAPLKKKLEVCSTPARLESKG